MSFDRKLQMCKPNFQQLYTSNQMLKLPGIRSSLRQSYSPKKRYSSLRISQALGQRNDLTLEKVQKSRNRINTQTNPTYKGRKIIAISQAQRSGIFQSPTKICQTYMRAYDSQLVKHLKKISKINQYKEIKLNKHNINLEHVIRLPKKQSQILNNKDNKPNIDFFVSESKVDKISDNDTECTIQWLNDQVIRSESFLKQKQQENRVDRRRYGQLTLKQILESDNEPWKFHRKKTENKPQKVNKQKHQFVRLYEGW